MATAAFFTHLGLLAAGAELVADDLTPVDLRSAELGELEAALFQLEAIRAALDTIEERLAAAAEEATPCVSS